MMKKVQRCGGFKDWGKGGAPIYCRAVAVWESITAGQERDSYHCNACAVGYMASTWWSWRLLRGGRTLLKGPEALQIAQRIAKQGRGKLDPRREMERHRQAVVPQGDALRQFYEWFKESGVWSDVRKGQRGGCRWTLTPAEAREGERLSDAVDAELKRARVR